MIRKIHLARCLAENDWSAIRRDMNLRPVNGINGMATERALINVLAKYGITAEAVSLWGTGKPLREFLWSEEMADACVYIMERVNFEDLKPSGKEIRNCHINIGTGKEVSIKSLAQLIQKTIGYTGAIEFDSTKPDGTMRKLTDVTKLHSLGWHHKIELEEGVSKLYDWYLNNLTTDNIRS